MTIVAPDSARPTQETRAWRELGLVVLAVTAYFGLRLVVEGDPAVARRNAERVLDVEARLGVDVEHDVQRWVLEHDLIRVLLSGAYVWLHWPLLIAAMVFLALRAPEVLARLRVAMVLSGTVGIVLFATLPMAPPRFVPGFVGTVSDAARRHYLPYSLDWTNQFAAFPSYHVGWTLITCLAVAGVVHGRLARTAMVLPAVVVAAAVVGTGNHYVLDSVTGAVFALTAWWAAGAWRSRGRRSGCRDDRDRPGTADQPDGRAVGDPTGGTVGRPDERAVELPGDDDRVAHQTAHLDRDRLDRQEARCP